MRTIIHLTIMNMGTAKNFSKSFQVAEIELVYTRSFDINSRPKICKASEAYQVLVKSWNPGRIELLDEFKILLLNQGNRVLGLYQVSQGGMTSTSSDIRLIFAAALRAGATGMVLAHNHPSGQLIASQADINATERIIEAARIMDVKVLDHLILSSEGYLSFRDEGLI